MRRLATLSTRIQPATKRALVDLCARQGLKVTAVVDQALREKLEDLEDSIALQEAMDASEEMLPYRTARRVLKRNGILR